MHTYLALGDSYTIGEQVPNNGNFPNQVVEKLRNIGITIAEPVIIAQTGWTTDELLTSIREHNLQETFSFVTLLIGVNNQYRNRTIENYRDEFTQLLNIALSFAKGITTHVIVVSIPDWGVTPFAEGRNQEQIAKEIDNYNTTCKEIALAANCHFVEITESTRKNGISPDYLANDGLHPSAKEYSIWADKIVKIVEEEFRK